MAKYSARRLSTAGTLVTMAAVLLAGCGGDGAEAQAAAHEHAPAEGGDVVSAEVADQVAAMRAATADYANDLDAALDDGFFIITQHIDDMGYHFLNPAVEGFDLADPPILVYARDGEDWQLVAVEWVFPEEPAEPPMEGASYGEFPAACHYADGLFVPEPDEQACADAHADSGSEFTFWHGDLVTFHVWAWMHNPDGLYHGTNPLMAAYN
jgi:hypothetical protein